TRPGQILGTASYMAPEQARGKAVDKRADIWAFGVVLYEMLSGRRLFTGETISDTLVAVLQQEPDWNRVSRKVQRLLKSCLEKDPKRRGTPGLGGSRQASSGWHEPDESRGSRPDLGEVVSRRCESVMLYER